MPSNFIPVIPQNRTSPPAPGATRTAAAAPPVALIARQAIVNARHEVIGYELFNRSRTAPTHPAATDVALVFATLSHAGTEELAGKKLIFINCTHESLAGGHLELLHPDKVVLEIAPLGHAAADEVALRLPILANLRQQGFRLAFNQTVLQSTYAAWLPLADYIKIDLSGLAPDHLAVLISYAHRHSQAELIAEKVETEQQYHNASDHGVELFQGYWFSRPVLVQAKLVVPTQGSIRALLALLRQQAGAQEIEDVLKKDAGLAFNLVRLIHSSNFGEDGEVTSFGQAAALLGHKKLLRWATLLLTTSRSGGAPATVGHAAVVRGRLMELLAVHSGQPRGMADQAFMVGIFSLIDTLLDMPMASALELMDMPAATRAALLKQEGVLGGLLSLVQAAEGGDPNGVLESACAAQHLSRQQLGAACTEALAWAGTGESPADA